IRLSKQRFPGVACRGFIFARTERDVCRHAVDQRIERIDLSGMLRLGQRLVMPCLKRQGVGEKPVSMYEAGVEGNRAAQILLGSRPVPVEEKLNDRRGFAGVRSGRAVLESLLCSGARLIGDIRRSGVSAEET